MCASNKTFNNQHPLLGKLCFTLCIFIIFLFLLVVFFIRVLPRLREKIKYLALGKGTFGSEPGSGPDTGQGGPPGFSGGDPGSSGGGPNSGPPGGGPAHPAPSGKTQIKKMMMILTFT